MKINQGITIFETMIVVAIIMLLASIIALNLSDFKKSRTIENTTSELVALINKARNNTISSLNSNNYGIHFEDDMAVLFSGLNYNPNDPLNEKIYFGSLVEIPDTIGTSLNGGGVDVVFEKVTGETDNYGTIIVRLKNDNNISKIITITRLGIISSN